MTGLTDGSGIVTKTYAYDAFGNEINPGETDTNPFRYCGEYFDGETGSIYLRARYYEPETGRFMSEDPVQDGVNWYVYCENDPVNFVDPSGYWTQTDNQYSTAVQAELLKLTVSWHLAQDPKVKRDIHMRAQEIRNIVSDGIGHFLDKGKKITGAAADEFAWGDVSRAERDYWLTQAQKFQKNIKATENESLHAMMFIAGIVSPSPDDAWRFISKKTQKKIIEKIGQKDAQNFLRATEKFAGKQGSEGIKKLKGNGINGYMYECKVKGKNDQYRLLGNKNQNGEIIWGDFQKMHH